MSNVFTSIVFQMLDLVACLPPSGGDRSVNWEYVIDRYEAEVESSCDLISIFKNCRVFCSKACSSIPREVKP